MYIGKKAIDDIYRHIENEQVNIKIELRRNIQAFRELERKQTILKRKIAKFGELLRFLRKTD